LGSGAIRFCARRWPDEHVRGEWSTSGSARLRRGGGDQVRLDHAVRFGPTGHADGLAVHELVLEFLPALPLQELFERQRLEVAL
jgi:hypothetical protein